MLALLGQISGGALAAGQPDAARPAIDEANALGVLCHAGSSPEDHKRHDCAMCPLCFCLVAPMAVLLPAPTPLPPPVVIAALARPRLPPARAPPAPSLEAAYPRGPPALI